MVKLKNIDESAAQKGSFMETAWQFVKFIIVSLLAFIVQFSLLNLLPLIPAISALNDREVSWFVFTYTAAAGGLGYAISSNTANIAAQIVAFFVNRKKTFNADNNVPVTLTVYILFTLALICFAAWFNPFFKDWLVARFSMGETAASNASTMMCSMIQFFVYFPVDKLLMRQKKTD